MFTEVEYTYLKNMIETYILKGDYTNYVAYTYTDISNDYSSEVPEMYIIFSRNEIISNGNTFTIPSDSLSVSIDTSSASRNSENGERYTFTESVESVTVPTYEFVYTNAKDSKYADLLAKEVYAKETNVFYNVTKDEFYLTPFLVGVLIMMLFFKWCFPMKGGKRV